MRSLILTSLVVAVALGCSSNDDERVSGLGPIDATCKPEGLCGGCTTCFDACLCGGGSTARCAEDCGGSNGGADAGTDAAAPVGTLAATLVTEGFDIPPGAEVFKCQNFTNPFGRDVAVLTAETFMTSGSHHLFVFQRPDVTDGPLESCSGLEFGPYLHLSQRSQQKTSFPPGIGRILEPTNGLRVQVHYFNSSPDTVRAEIAVTLRADEPQAVPTLASQIFINTIGISVPPLSPGRAHKECDVPKDVNLHASSSHMHKHGTYFTARTDDGQLLFETNEWEEPEPWIFDPPRRLKAGSKIVVDCEYQNDTPFPLSFGESADTNEMCIFTGVYYPAGRWEAIGCVF
jgi:hypothetical protein